MCVYILHIIWNEMSGSSEQIRMEPDPRESNTTQTTQRLDWVHFLSKISSKKSCVKEDSSGNEVFAFLVSSSFSKSQRHASIRFVLLPSFCKEGYPESLCLLFFFFFARTIEKVPGDDGG